MSGPVQIREAAYENEACHGVEVRRGREATLGGIDIVRVLPTKGRRTVGPWCFVDLIVPSDAEHPDPMEIGPHPHTGLATVTWLLDGVAEHSDSLGTKQLIRPGELNLMSSGHGIAHAEQGMGPNLRGVQMWVAQPEGTRHGPSGFEHHADLPAVDLPNGEAIVMVGAFAGAGSPARADWAIVGAELRLRRGASLLPVAGHYEHAVVPLDRPVLVGDTIVEPGSLGLVPIGIEALRIDAGADPSSVLLLGGEPFGERIQMWWNFVARTRDEITDAWRAWEADDTDRFGRVPSSLERIDAPRPPWVHRADG
jgi:redox-sensitive bicupin YhaK (pirin superfamily)